MSLREDVGAGDLTTAFTVAPELRGRAAVTAGESVNLCGLLLFDPLAATLSRMGPPGAGADALVMSDSAGDGVRLEAGERACVIEGPVQAILTLERTFLNYLGHLSGIATETWRFTSALKGAGLPTRVLDTRKTTPGMRILEKYAVCCGGGHNHRLGLFDAVLIKDNHVVAAGGIAAAVRLALEGAAGRVEVEVECDTMGQVREAVGAGATAVLLDNFSEGEVREAVGHIAGRARVEVSGGVKLDTVVSYAAAGADDVSIGRLTHSAPSSDFSMELSILV